MSKWNSITEKRPPRDDRYLVYAPSADTDKPLIVIAWYNPGNPPESRWSLLPKLWGDSITHWMEVPPPPKEKR